MARVRKQNGTGSRVSPYGYFKPRGGMLWGFYRDHRTSLQLENKRSNYPEARDKLDAWIKELDGNGDRQPTRVPTLMEAQREYVELKLKRKNAPTKLLFVSALTMFFGADMRDMPLDDDRLLRHLSARIDSLVDPDHPEVSSLTGRPYAINTILDRVGSIRSMLRYFHRRKWLRDGDPFDLIELPQRPKTDDEARIYSPIEHARIVIWMQEQYDAVWSRMRPEIRRNGMYYRLLWSWLMYSGMRISEVLAMRWPEGVTDPKEQTHVTDKAIHIRRAKGGKNRNVPLDAIPELRLLLQMLRELPPVAGNRVWPWTCSRSVDEILEHCLTDLGIDGGERHVHVYRATAKALWIERHVPQWLCDYWAGHGRRVSEKHYDSHPSIEMMIREAGIPPAVIALAAA